MSELEFPTWKNFCTRKASKHSHAAVAISIKRQAHFANTYRSAKTPPKRGYPFELTKSQSRRAFAALGCDAKLRVASDPSRKCLRSFEKALETLAHSRGWCVSRHVRGWFEHLFTRKSLSANFDQRSSICYRWISLIFSTFRSSEDFLWVKQVLHRPRASFRRNYVSKEVNRRRQPVWTPRSHSVGCSTFFRCRVLLSFRLQI